VKDVPAGATVVGIPGRVVKRDAASDEHHQRRRDFAKKIGFDAYGTTQDMPDPVANAIDRMLDHIHALDNKLEMLCESLKKADIEIKDMPLPTLKSSELDGPTQEDGGGAEQSPAPERAKQ
jgi:serine O-acetyltransferase